MEGQDSHTLETQAVKNLTACSAPQSTSKQKPFVGGEGDLQKIEDWKVFYREKLQQMKSPQILGFLWGIPALSLLICLGSLWALLSYYIYRLTDSWSVLSSHGDILSIFAWMLLPLGLYMCAELLYCMSHIGGNQRYDKRLKRKRFPELYAIMDEIHGKPWPGRLYLGSLNEMDCNHEHGFFSYHPRVRIGFNLLLHFSARELKPGLAHELGHLHYKDSFCTNWLGRFVSSLYWLRWRNRFYFLLANRLYCRLRGLQFALNEFREIRADEFALQHSSKEDFSRCFLKLYVLNMALEQFYVKDFYRRWRKKTFKFTLTDYRRELAEYLCPQKSSEFTARAAKYGVDEDYYHPTPPERLAVAGDREKLLQEFDFKAADIALFDSLAAKDLLQKYYEKTLKSFQKNVRKQAKYKKAVLACTELKKCQGFEQELALLRWQNEFEREVEIEQLDVLWQQNKKEWLILEYKCELLQSRHQWKELYEILPAELFSHKKGKKIKDQVTADIEFYEILPYAALASKQHGEDKHALVYQQRHWQVKCDIERTAPVVYYRRKHQDVHRCFSNIFPERYFG